MKTKEKQNKHKLKFNYISQLQMLGKIWKQHQNLVNPKISKNDKNYNSQVVKLMNKKTINDYCIILDRCDDILANIRKVDGSLKFSHQKFSNYKKLILQKGEK